MSRSFAITFILLLACFFIQAQEGQIAISRISLMPNQPSPYNMRDWGQVATNYDRFTYDLNKTGTYLPLIHILPNGVNYPERTFFSQVTYVGSPNIQSGEAINILPGLVGASLMGIDKSSQDGYNYLLMAQDYFNKKNGEMLYLNSNSTESGNDWWYDMMPNIFFYQLYNLYPNWGGEASSQFESVAELMHEAVDSMGGSATPWSKPNMNYRAWKFSSMEPKATGVPEPEAAGAFSWLLYHAYKETGVEKYRIGAEWAMEYLSSLNGNPSYELQLPYGTYVAAKMNAELGTKYDIEKMVNWSFDKGNLRGWGTIVDTWSGIDVSGLVGESESDTDYAFQLNGIQQAATLVPMTRYDKRFARSIAKWVLNLANANRLFYHSFLPSSLQDATEWSSEYDLNRVIGYEAIKENYNGLSPYSTGDAVNGGWAETNLALYGTSSIGYLGSMLGKTNIEKILKLDLLKTDFFRDQAYPSYLIYNSYNTEKAIDFYTGTGNYDIYDPLTETFLKRDVSGSISLVIPADQAIMPVIVPANGDMTFEKNKLLIDGVVVDFGQHQVSYSNNLRLKSISASKSLFSIGQEVEIFSSVEYEGPISDLNFTWTINGVTSNFVGDKLVINAENIGSFNIQLVVKSTEESDSSKFNFTVIEEIQEPPIIQSLILEQKYSAPGGVVHVVCNAIDPNEDELIYDWDVNGGTISGNSNEVIWTVPNAEGIYVIKVTVRDPSLLTDEREDIIIVKIFEENDGNLIAYYPLDLNANDLSGNELDGILIGGISTFGYNGQNNEAYFFNGTTHYMKVENNPILNFTDQITLSFWMKPDVLPDRESFLVSHGSWQNRWKASIIPEGKIRWTIKTTNGLADLDSKKLMQKDSFIHVILSYDGSLLTMYLNGKMENFTPLTGSIRITNYPLLLAQSLPDESAYNFKGVLDEVKLFDFALTPNQANNLFKIGELTSSLKDQLSHELLQIYPNPVSDELVIHLSTYGQVDKVLIFDASGRKIINKEIEGEIVKISFKGLKSGLYFLQFLKGNELKSVRKIILN